MPAGAAFAEPAFAAWQARWHARLDRQCGDRAAAFEGMRRANPAYIPRNHQVEAALAAGAAGDLAPLYRLLEVLADPCTERTGLEDYAQPAVPDGRVYQTFCGT